MTIHAPARLGLIGGECTGKSALANALANALPACVVGEALRDFVERTGRTPTRAEQRDRMIEQQAAEDAAAATCVRPTLVADPAPLMTAVYSLLYFDDDSLITEALELAGGYTLLAWCDMDLPWQPDWPHRDGPHHRDRAHAIIADLVRTQLASRGIAVVRASGPLTVRVEAVRRAWQPRGHLAPT